MNPQLYTFDIGQTQFNAQVVAVEPRLPRYAVCLDRSEFFPGGGGQPHDTGWLEDIPVSAVEERDDILWHVLERPPDPLWAPGTPVNGRINPQRRLHTMQQHTGQHIISAAFWHVAGLTTLSVHLGEHYTTIEVDHPDLPPDLLRETQDLANRVIAFNLPVSWFWVEPDQLSCHPLRKPPTRSGRLRLVAIGDFDLVACGGLHLSSTGPVRLVQAVAREKIRGHSRITWKIGDSALQDYQQKHLLLSQLKTLLSAHDELLENKIVQLQQELVTGRQKYNALEDSLVETHLERILAQPLRFPSVITDIVTACTYQLEDTLVKKLVKSLLKRPHTIFCLLNSLPQRVSWYIGCSGSETLPITPLLTTLLPLIGGRGGGGFPLWQGSGNLPDGIPAFLKTFPELLRPLLPMESNTNPI